jgi:hypothetical protein
MATQLTQGESYASTLRRSGGAGVLQVIYGSATIYLHGSLNGSDYTLIESFSASTIKEIVLCPHFKYSSSSDPDAAGDGALGTHKVIIDETQGG